MSFSNKFQQGFIGLRNYGVSSHGIFYRCFVYWLTIYVLAKVAL